MSKHRAECEWCGTDIWGPEAEGHWHTHKGRETFRLCTPCHHTTLPADDKGAE